MTAEQPESWIAVTGLVKGRVQGVFFRAETQAKARSLGLVGWVKNTLEGDVAVMVAGPSSAVETMRDWLRKGPPLARVDRLELVDCALPDSEGFDIQY